MKLAAFLLLLAVAHACLPASVDVEVQGIDRGCLNLGYRINTGEEYAPLMHKL